MADTVVLTEMPCWQLPPGSIILAPIPSNTPRYARETGRHGTGRLSGSLSRPLPPGCTRTGGGGSSLPGRPPVPYVLDRRDRPADRRGRRGRDDPGAVCRERSSVGSG